MKLSLIINHYREPEMLKMSLGYALKALAYLKESAGVETEIIVTDSETLPQTAQMMQTLFPEVIFLAEEKNIGFGKSVNRAVRKANGEFTFVMNADVILAFPDALTKLLAFVEKNSEVGIAGPKLLNINGSLQASAFRFYTPLTILARRTLFGKSPWGKKNLHTFLIKDKAAALAATVPVDWVMGSAFLCRRERFLNLGMFDETFFMYMEDVDLCRRFWERGYKVMYYPEATAYHYHFQASKKRGGILDALFNKYTRIHLKSAYTYFKKHGLNTPRYGI